MVAFNPLTLLCVNPVVRPLFFTFCRNAAATVVCEMVPISRILPVASTMPGTTCPTEQSTLLPGSELFFTSVATVWAPAALQFTSINPG
jgi:hypothetical protein